MLRWLALALAMMALAPGSAIAARGHPTYLAPPGNPAVTEYLEDVPSALGSVPPGSGGTPAHRLTTRQTRQLAHLGATGELLVNVDRATSPRRLPVRKKHAAPKVSRPAAEERTDPRTFSGSGSGSVSAVISAATEQGTGSGLLLPGLIAGGLAVAGGIVVRRRRTR